jgi:hypothetical protein
LVISNEIDDGVVMSMGEGSSYGQLGHGDAKPRLHPTVIEAFTEKRIIDIGTATTSRHALALTSKFFVIHTEK